MLCVKNISATFVDLTVYLLSIFIICQVTFNHSLCHTYNTFLLVSVDNNTSIISFPSYVLSCRKKSFAQLQRYLALHIILTHPYYTQAAATNMRNMIMVEWHVPLRLSWAQTLSISNNIKDTATTLYTSRSKDLVCCIKSQYSLRSVWPQSNNIITLHLLSGSCAKSARITLNHQ